MVEIIGELVAPSALIVPTRTPASQESKAQIGTLVMSGAKLYVATALGTFELITSA